MEKEFIDEVKRKYYSDTDWKYHILPVLNYSKALADELGANIKIIEYSAVLHDIGRVKFGPENHNLTSADEAEGILASENLTESELSLILNCIRSHGGSKEHPTDSIEAEIIKNADAMSHYDVFPTFFMGRDRTDMNIVERVSWTRRKFTKNWERKLTLPAAKKAVEKKHESIILLIDTLSKLSIEE